MKISMLVSIFFFAYISLCNGKILTVNHLLATKTAGHVPLLWETYTNNEMGISFQHPKTWDKNGDEIKSINLSGELTTLEVDFVDTLFGVSLSVLYHFPPNGKKLFDYKYSDFLSSSGWYVINAKETTVAGQKAIVANRIINQNGKGESLTTPVKSIVVDFLDRTQKGEIEIQFRTKKIDSETEISKFNQFLASVKFLR